MGFDRLTIISCSERVLAICVSFLWALSSDGPYPFTWIRAVGFSFALLQICLMAAILFQSNTAINTTSGLCCVGSAHAHRIG